MSEYVDAAGRTITPFLSRLRETPAFMGQGLGDEARKEWPAKRLLCGRGHRLGSLRLVNGGSKGWAWEAVEPLAAVDSAPGDNTRTLDGVNFLRSTFHCAVCERKTGKQSRIPLRGDTLLKLYAAAVVQGQKAVKLDGK